jgi:hypothetical protein
MGKKSAFMRSTTKLNAKTTAKNSKSQIALINLNVLSKVNDG